MLTKVLFTAAAAALISTAAFAQDEESKPQDQSATSPNTVNPVTHGDDHVDNVGAPTGVATDVVAISPEEARARGIAVQVVASAPVPDTPENRRRFGQPLSNAGRNTAPRGN